MGQGMAMGRKAALITGAARRVGRAIATHLAGEGWDIAIHYNTSRGEALGLQQELTRTGVSCRLYAADLTEPQAAERLVEQCVADFPHASLLVNSASVFKRDTIATLSPALWDEQLRINALAPILLTRAFHRLSAAQNCVINMLDQKVANATPDFFSYTISKLALHNATRMMAMSLWPKTRVNGIAPGIVLRSGDQTEEQFRAVHSRTPLGIGPSLAEICRATALLADTPSITGQVITIDGGRHLLSKFPFEDLPKE
jgi:NAD(P)-dependent dehydrogenase (short-subunit alcohol dehydrogenase family)